MGWMDRMDWMDRVSYVYIGFCAARSEGGESRCIKGAKAKRLKSILL